MRRLALSPTDAPFSGSARYAAKSALNPVCTAAEVGAADGAGVGTGVAVGFGDIVGAGDGDGVFVTDVTSAVGIADAVMPDWLL